jgi:hypothetical protein
MGGSAKYRNIQSNSRVDTEQPGLQTRDVAGDSRPNVA